MNSLSEKTGLFDMTELIWWSTCRKRGRERERKSSCSSNMWTIIWHTRWSRFCVWWLHPKHSCLEKDCFGDNHVPLRFGRSTACWVQKWMNKRKTTKIRVLEKGYCEKSFHLNQICLFNSSLLMSNLQFFVIKISFLGEEINDVHE